jgi:hypothetical protein
MQIGTRVKVIDEQACIRMFADVKKGDKGTVIDSGEIFADVHFDKLTGDLVYIVPIEALKRLHVKKVETTCKDL